jgi:hypothetical protein
VRKQAERESQGQDWPSALLDEQMVTHPCRRLGLVMVSVGQGWSMCAIPSGG